MTKSELAPPFSRPGPDGGRPAREFGGRTRLLVLVLSTLALAFVMANSLALNFTVICMRRERPEGVLVRSQNLTGPEPELLYGQSERAWLFSAVALGNLLGTPPFVVWSGRRGGREAFTAFALLSAAATALTPPAARAGFWFVFACRLAQVGGGVWAGCGTSGAQPEGQHHLSTRPKLG